MPKNKTDLFKIALCQMQITEDKNKNNEKALSMIAESAKNGAKFVVLPEMFNCPYDVSLFEKYAQTEDDLSIFKKSAAENGVYLFCGSVPEIDDGKLYNTCYIMNPCGKNIGKFRKIHLFDIDIPGKIVFKESLTLCPGNDILIAETEFCDVGIAICFDVRFPDMFDEMRKKGAKFVIIPAAFNMTTGPAHWEVLMRARALDNQIFVAACAGARNDNGYISYANSIIVGPWGDVKARAGENEEILYFKIDIGEIQSVRKKIPIIDF